MSTEKYLPTMCMKICKLCKVEKQLTEFSPAAKYKDKQYYRGECKDCNKLIQQSDQTAQIKYRNSERGKAVKAAYKKTRKYRKQQTEYELFKRKTNPFVKCKFLIRNRLRQCLKKKFWLKRSKFAEYIGCTKDELIKYLESKFTEGMTWENQGKWHIDHIIPLSSATSEEEMYKLCHYTNLQPLWAIDNIKKSNKISEDV